MFTIQVNGQILEAVCCDKIVADSINMLEVKFNFSNEWEGLTKTAQFSQKQENGEYATYNVLLDEIGMGDFPNEIKEGIVIISVFGVDGTRLMTTAPLAKPVEKSGYITDGETPIPPTPDLYQQIIAEFTAAMAKKADAQHAHAQSDITGLADALAGKADAQHAHAQSDITGLADALAGKADAQHAHAQSDITGLQTALSKRDRVHNLLVNSNFQVNRRGTTEISGNDYIVDLWFNSTGTSKLTNNGVQVTSGTEGAAYLSQFIETIKDGVFTFAAKVNGNIVLRVVQISGTTVTTIRNEYAAYSGGYLQFTYNSSHGGYEAAFRVERENTITIEWTALYEGEYTPETLPSYVRNGYATEFAECSRHYTVIGRYQTLNGFITGSAKEAWVSVFLPVPMRLASPTVATMPKVILRGVNGYSALTPSRDDAIVPTSALCTAENTLNGNVLRIRFYFDSAIDTNNTPVSVYLDSKCAISAELKGGI